MSDSYYQSASGLTIGGTIAIPPEPDRILTGSVETTDGHLAQIRVGGEIVWESEAYDSTHLAQSAARERVQRLLAELFA